MAAVEIGVVMAECHSAANSVGAAPHHLMTNTKKSLFSVPLSFGNTLKLVRIHCLNTVMFCFVFQIPHSCQLLKHLNNKLDCVGLLAVEVTVL